MKKPQLFLLLFWINIIEANASTEPSNRRNRRQVILVDSRTPNTYQDLYLPIYYQAGYPSGITGGINGYPSNGIINYGYPSGNNGALVNGYPSNGIINYGYPSGNNGALVNGYPSNGIINYGLPSYGTITNGLPYNQGLFNGLGTSGYQTFNNGAYDATACDGQQFSISCPQGSNIRIISTRYGRQDTYTCAANYYSYYATNPLQNNPECLLATAKPIVESNCNNKPYCNFLVSSTVFGGVDPCQSLPKALQVRFQCF